MQSCHWRPGVEGRGFPLACISMNPIWITLIKNTRKEEPKQLPKSTKTEKSTRILNSFLDTTACTQEILLKNDFWSYIIVDPFPAYCLAKESKLTKMMYIVQAEHYLLDSFTNYLSLSFLTTSFALLGPVFFVCFVVVVVVAVFVEHLLHVGFLENF